MVRLWLQHKQGAQWQDQPDGPHLIIRGTAEEWPLTSEQLSSDKPNHGNNNRPRKRSFNKNKNWRIGKIQVGSNPELYTTGYDFVRIEFQDHFH